MTFKGIPNKLHAGVISGTALSDSYIHKLVTFSGFN